jgi:hypothetical protein
VLGLLFLNVRAGRDEPRCSPTEWDFNWANVEWIRENYDRVKFVSVWRGTGRWGDHCMLCRSPTNG